MPGSAARWWSPCFFTVSFAETASSEDFDFDRRFPNNDAFEEKIKNADEACLPDPFPLIKHNYGYRLADGLITECATENMTTGQAVKYTALATSLYSAAWPP